MNNIQNTEKYKEINLKDYKTPPFLIEHVFLDVNLAPDATCVTSALTLLPNPKSEETNTPLILDGDELKLVSLSLNGAPLPAEAYTCSPEKLMILPQFLPSSRFQITIKTEINPASNRKLMGLYLSSNVYCTQCEADGFRRLTYFMDRPDVMSLYEVRIEADKTLCPVLLCNGNPIETGDVPPHPAVDAASGAINHNRHYAIWRDPFKKPCYLFALVAGDLDVLQDHFITMSGRKVELGIYVEKGKAPRATYAMDALKRSMRWDEEAFGREYDLDLFNIVAVSDFNMGAMENKGLNIFNDKYILASPDTATDQDYHNIEAIVAHEYFHNWTGNRITCRDWFQLCLKEGLTVFRDQEFSSDQRSRAVERIANVQTLRMTQFVEDAGPLAHSVRPARYKEINNFYTATVYNKGSELIQMLKILVGEPAFRQGMDLYFERHDGEAAIVEQFLQCFADVSGQDLTPFLNWYQQAGTPHIKVETHYDAPNASFDLTFTQETAPTPHQPTKTPQIIPIRLGFIGEAGETLLAEDVLVMTDSTLKKRYTNVKQRPIPSLFRGFSAPVKVEFPRSEEDLFRLARYDSDPFNRWQALHEVALSALKQRALAANEPPTPRHQAAMARLAQAYQALIHDQEKDPAFAALAITLPSEGEIAQEIAQNVDPEAITRALQATRADLAVLIHPNAEETYAKLQQPRPFQTDGRSAGQRSMKAQLLRYLVAADPKEGGERAFLQFSQADNMSDRIFALQALLYAAPALRDEALARFETAYQGDPLILDMWFSLCARIPDVDILTRIRGLMRHPQFTLDNPNRVRALIATFASANLSAFHALNGEGYTLVSEVIRKLDHNNPQIAARLTTMFRTWRSLEPQRRAKAQNTLLTLQDHGQAGAALSRDVSDILDRILS